MHPQVATRDCDHCQKWWYKDDGTINRHSGRDLLRTAACPAPCRTPVGCPKGTPEDQRGLTPNNVLAYEFYQECRAVGEWPDDPRVKRDASLINRVLENCDKEQQLQIALLTAGKP